MIYCIDVLQTSLFMLILSFICQIFFLSIFFIRKDFVKYFWKTVQARVVILIIQVDNDVLYRGIANQPYYAYSSMYLSHFLSFHILNNEIFRQRLLWNRESKSSNIWYAGW